MYQKIAEQILKYRFGILGILILLFGWVIWQAPNLKIDNSISSWYTDDDPTLLAYQEFLKTFGNDDVIVCGIRDSLSYDDPDRVRSTRGFTEAIGQIKGIVYVSSYVQFPFKYRSNDVLTLESILETTDPVPASGKIREWMDANPSRNRLIGRSSDFTLVYAWPDTTEYVEQNRSVILQQIDSVFLEHRLSNEAVLSKGGIGVVYNGINETTLSEGGVFLLLSYLILIVAVLLVTRSVWITGLALLTITCGNLSLFGFMLLFGKPINIVTLALPPLIMVIGVSNFIHFTLHTRAKLEKKIRQTSVILPVVAFIAIPITFNMLTTAGGFFSLTVSSIQITRDYGLLAALSILSVSSLSIVAAVWFHRRLLQTQLPSHRLLIHHHWVKGVMRWSMSNYRLVIGFNVLLIAFSVMGFFRIVVDTEPLSFIPRHHPIRQDNQLLTEEAGNYVPLEFVLELPEGSWKQTRNFGRLREVQDRIEADSAVSSTLSVLDFALDAYQRSPGAKLASVDSLHQLSQRKLGLISSNLWQDPFIQRLTTRRGDRLRIMAAIPLTTAYEFRKIHERIDAQLDLEFGEQLSVTPSGYIPLYSRIVDTVLSDQIKSLSLALAVIFLLILIVLRSMRFTLLALPSNLMPVLMIIGAMGFFHIPLDIASVTLAATILGIIVDDSLHILFTYQEQFNVGVSAEEATDKVAELTGSAVLHTSLILILGYSIIAISTVPILSTTGILMMVAIVAALMADLFLLPALLMLFWKKLPLRNQD
jgi:predicted RND superfamily exporter protein